MPRIEPGDGGGLVVVLEADESIRIAAGGSTLTVALDGEGALTTTLAGGRTPLAAPPASNSRSAAAGSPAGHDEGGASSTDLDPLTAARAVDEVLNAFQQANVRARGVKQTHKENTPEHAQAVDALKGEAMDRVVEICGRYQLSRRGSPPQGE